MNNEFGMLLNDGIIATNKKYPKLNMGEQINGAIKEYLDILNKDSKNYITANSEFCKCFTRVDIDTKADIRERFKQASYTSDSVLSLLDYMYKYSFDELKKASSNSERIDSFLKYANAYINLIQRYKTPNLSSARAKIYLHPEEIKNIVSLATPLINYYVEKTLSKKNSSIKIKDFTDTGKQVFSNIENINNYVLADSYKRTYKAGNVNIDMASTLGYKNRKKPQQDAILSTSKNGYSISIVADGAGGSVNGQVASTITIAELKKWFDNCNFSIFDNISPNDIESIKKASAIISDSLDRKIKEINQIVQDKCENSLSTVVISLVTPGFVLFANVGDSTAYAYDKDKNTLTEKTVLDSRSKGLSYEEARYNPHNNQITNAIGMLGDDIHYNVMPNKGAYRIIMSSDGITDLINANSFAFMASRGYPAEAFVGKADKMPDIGPGIKKTEDNISAIIIDSEDYTKKKGRVR